MSDKVTSDECADVFIDSSGLSRESFGRATIKAKAIMGALSVQSNEENIETLAALLAWLTCQSPDPDNVVPDRARIVQVVDRAAVMLNLFELDMAKKPETVS